MKTATQEPAISIIEQIQSAPPDTNIRQWTEETKGAAQGDLNLIRLPEDFDFSGMEKVSATQLTPGATQGSRHTIDPKDFEVYKPYNFGQVERVQVRGKLCFRWIGYALKSLTPNGRIDHPEHAAHCVCGANIQTYGQVDLKTQERVRD